jgi:hypothetical protein
MSRKHLDSACWPPKDGDIRIVGWDELKATTQMVDAFGKGVQKQTTDKPYSLLRLAEKPMGVASRVLLPGPADRKTSLPIGAGGDSPSHNYLLQRTCGGLFGLP